MTSARVTGIGHALPAPYSQQGVWDGFFSRHYAGAPIAEQIFANSGVRTRHAVANPVDEDVSGWGTGRRMERYLAEALPLGKDAVATALADAGLDPGDVGLFSVASCTGYVTPGVDIRLARDLGMSDQVRRLFVGHMGCYAALPALGAVADFVAARGRPAVLLCLELTSLHIQPASEEIDQVVAHALFADAAAAVVVEPVGAERGSGSLSGSGSGSGSLSRSGPLSGSGSGSGSGSLSGSGPLSGFGGSGPGRGRSGPVGPGWEIVDVVAQTDVSTADHMTWDVTDQGFRMGLSPRVPAVLARHVRGVVDGLLDGHGLTRDDVDGWAVHPGGRRILEVVQRRLDLPDGALDASYGVLADHGNCSSPTVLLVLERITAARTVAPGRYAVAMAFGPGLTLYAALLRAA